MRLRRGVTDLRIGEGLGSHTPSPSTEFWQFAWTIHRQIHVPTYVVSDSFHITGALTHKLIFSFLCVCVCLSFSHIQLFVSPIAGQAPLSMGFSRQEYWRGLPFPSPGDLPNPGIEFRSPIRQVDSLPSEPRGYLTAIYSTSPVFWVPMENFDRKILVYKGIVIVQVMCPILNSMSLSPWSWGCWTVMNVVIILWLNCAHCQIHILLKPGLENFEHYFTSGWDDCNCAVV